LRKTKFAGWLAVRETPTTAMRFCARKSLAAAGKVFMR
jgi:hypothetical protein